MIVAQFTKTLPPAPCSSESVLEAKIERIAASSVTTVRITSEAAVTPAGAGGVARRAPGRLAGALGVDVAHRGDRVADVVQPAGHVRAHPTDTDDADARRSG